MKYEKSNVSESAFIHEVQYTVCYSLFFMKEIPEEVSRSKYSTSKAKVKEKRDVITTCGFETRLLCLG